VVERGLDEIRDLLLSVDGSHVTTGSLQLSAKSLGVLHGGVTRLLCGRLSVRELAPFDQTVELDLCGDLSRLDIGIQCSDENVYRLVRRAEVHFAVCVGELDE
jgi:hypothetical protein